MKEKVLKYYHPLLRKKSEKIEDVRGVEELVEGMKRVLQEKKGAGLAAPQVGVLKRVVVINTEEGLLSFINPEIIEKSKETITFKEGCLSLQGVWIDVVRSNKVKVRALDEKGEEVELMAEGILAVIFQHEIDHLDGKLFIDRIGFFRKIKVLFSYYFQKNNGTV